MADDPRTTDPRICVVCNLPIRGPGALHCSAIHHDEKSQLGEALRSTVCMTDSQQPDHQTTGWRGPNAAGWCVILACAWMSYAEWTLWPVGVLVAMCIPSAVLMALDARGRMTL